MPRVPGNEDIGNVARDTRPVFSQRRHVGSVRQIPSVDAFGGREAKELVQAAGVIGGIGEEMTERKNRNDAVLANSIYRDYMSNETTRLKQLRGRDARDVESMYLEAEAKARTIATKGRNRNVQDRLFGMFENNKVQGVASFRAHQANELVRETRAANANRAKELIEDGVVSDPAGFQGALSAIREIYMGDEENGVPRPTVYTQAEGEAMYKAASAELHNQKLKYLFASKENKENVMQGVKLMENESFKRDLPPDVYASHINKAKVLGLDIATDRAVFEVMEGMSVRESLEHISSMPEGTEKEMVVSKYRKKISDKHSMETAIAREVYEDVRNSLPEAPVMRDRDEFSANNIDEAIKVEDRWDAYRAKLATLSPKDRESFEIHRVSFENQLNRDMHRFRQGMSQVLARREFSDRKDFTSDSFRDYVDTLAAHGYIEPAFANSILNRSESYGKAGGSGSSSGSGGGSPLYTAKTALKERYAGYIEDEGKKLSQGDKEKLSQVMTSAEYAFRDNTDIHSAVTDAGKFFEAITKPDENGNPAFLGMATGDIKGVDVMLSQLLGVNHDLGLGSGVLLDTVRVMRERGLSGSFGDRTIPDNDLLQMVALHLMEDESTPEPLRQRLIALNGEPDLFDLLTITFDEEEELKKKELGQVTKQDLNDILFGMIRDDQLAGPLVGGTDARGDEGPLFPDVSDQEIELLPLGDPNQIIDVRGTKVRRGDFEAAKDRLTGSAQMRDVREGAWKGFASDMYAASQVLDVGFMEGDPIGDWFYDAIDKLVYGAASQPKANDYGVLDEGFVNSDGGS